MAELLRLPTETEIYLLPDGRVVISDLPEPLSGLVSALGVTEPCELLIEQPSDTCEPALADNCSPLPLD